VGTLERVGGGKNRCREERRPGTSDSLLKGAETADSPLKTHSSARGGKKKTPDSSARNARICLQREPKRTFSRLRERRLGGRRDRKKKRIGLVVDGEDREDKRGGLKKNALLVGVSVGQKVRKE